MSYGESKPYDIRWTMHGDAFGYEITDHVSGLRVRGVSEARTQKKAEREAFEHLLSALQNVHNKPHRRRDPNQYS